MSSTKILGVAWLLTILSFAGIYSWAEVNYIPADQKNTVDDAKDKPKPKITVKAKVGLMEAYGDAFLPRIAEDGKTAFQTYAAPPPEYPTRYRIAILVTRLGYRQNELDFAINKLPRDISLSFSPYTDDLLKIGEQARAQGHEVFIDMPMEPLDTALQDPTALALMINNSQAQNIKNMRTIMSNMQGYVGVVGQMGSRFLSQRTKVAYMIDEIKQRGVMYVDNKSTNFTRGPTIARNNKVPYAINDITIDQDLNPSEILNNLLALEELARKKGVAVGFASGKLVTLRQLEKWAPTLARKGITLMPISAIASQQATQ